MNKTVIKKWSGPVSGAMLIIGIAGLLWLAAGLAFTPRLVLSSSDGQIEQANQWLYVQDLERKSKGYLQRWIAFPAANRIRFRLNTGPAGLFPVKYRLEGKVSMRREARRAPDFDQSFDGFTLAITLNGTPAYAAVFTVSDTGTKSLSIPLPAGRETEVEITNDPGPAGNNAYDWAFIKGLQAKPVPRPGWIVIPCLALVGGAALLIAGRRAKAPMATPDAPAPGPARLSPGRKAAFSAAIALTAVLVAGEASFSSLTRLPATHKLAPWLVPSDRVRIEEAEDFQFDPETGFVRPPGLDMEYQFKNGDIFIYGYTDLERKEGESIRFRTDEHGFRSSVAAAEARVAVLGDSFTEAGNIAEPFPGRVGKLLSVPVYNLGVTCYGTIQEALIARRMLPRLPALETMALVWYGGNDPVDNQQFYALQETGNLTGAFDNLLTSRAGGETARRPYPFQYCWTGRVALRLCPRIEAAARFFDRIEVLGPDASGPDGRDSDPKAREPKTPAGANRFMLPLESGDAELAFYPPDLNRIYSGELARGPGVELGLEALESLWQDLNQRGVKLLVCYMPDKLSVYLPALAEAYGQEELGRRLSMFLLSRPEEDGPREVFHQFESVSRSMPEALRDFCAARGIAFLDLTPDLRRAGQERLVYFENDTHLNPEGHQVVAEAMARALASFPAATE